jgi:hypothetical protein
VNSNSIACKVPCSWTMLRRDSAEALRAELATYSPAMKLTLLTNCGSLAAMIGLFVAWAAGEDPLGRMPPKHLPRVSVARHVTPGLQSLHGTGYPTCWPTSI